METGLRDKVVLVTGAASGIGRATVESLCHEGARVVALDRDAEELDRLHTAQPGVDPLLADLSTETGVEEAVGRTLDRHGAVDVLINNAGMGVVGDLTSTTTEQWETTFAVNTRAPFLLCRALIPTMIARNGGVIVNVASAAAVSAVKERAAYSASKGAIIALTRSIAVDYGPAGIRANAVAPGTVATPWIGRMTGQQTDPEAARRDMERRQLIGRLGEPQEVADAIVYLASDRSSFQ